MYRIMTINATARRLLGIREIVHDQDFLHTVRGLPYQEVRQAIDTAFREHSTISVQDLELDDDIEGVHRYLNLTIMNMQVAHGARELVVITAADVTEQVQMKSRIEAVQREQAELVSELSAANKRFTAMNRELQDANEELQAANEELMLTQEELQATNEEFEATNEELQATNEELETNNEELQATNEELQTTNDELTARTIELQETMKQHSREQIQLSKLLERFPAYVMIVNAADLTVQRVNPAYQQILAGREVVGLPISEIFSSHDVDHLIELLQRAVSDGQTVRTRAINATIADGDGNARMVHTAVPIPDDTGAAVDRLFVYSEKQEVSGMGSG
jgi:two-component system CheB/CheR fusion protein